MWKTGTLLIAAVAFLTSSFASLFETRNACQVSPHSGRALASCEAQTGDPDIGLPIQALTDHLKCDLFQPPKDSPYSRGPTLAPGRGLQTAYWTQEMIGADLATEFLSTLPSQEVPVGIIDTQFNLKWLPKNKFISSAAEIREVPYGIRDQLDHGWHGTQVASLIVGDPPVGTGSRARISRLFSHKSGTGLNGAEEVITTGDHRPWIVNMSMSCTSEDGYCKDFNPAQLRKLVKDTVLVKCAGNRFPLVLDRVARFQEPIVVGNMNAFGLMAHSSQEGEEVVISAPSDYSTQSYGPHTDEKHSSPTGMTHDPGKIPAPQAGIYNTSFFSGTSSAAPQVTGALTNVMSLLPGITSDELKTMLRKTAIKTAAFQPDSGKNGAGALNAYLLVRAAGRLKDGGWPKNRDSIPVMATYDFREDATRLRKNAEKLLDDLNCSHQRLALKVLRKAFFLNPTDTRARELLSELYSRHGYHPQSLYVAQKPLSETIKAVKDPDYRKAMIQRHLLHQQAKDWEWDNEEWDYDICDPYVWEKYGRFPPKDRCPTPPSGPNPYIPDAWKKLTSPSKIR